MKKHFSSVKNYNCFCWSLHNRCYFFMFFRLAQNVDVERQTCTKEKTQKNSLFLCSLRSSFVRLKLQTTSCSPEKCKRIAPVLQAILAVTANLPLFKMSLGNIIFHHLFLVLISKLYYVILLSNVPIFSYLRENPTKKTQERYGS